MACGMRGRVGALILSAVSLTLAAGASGAGIAPGTVAQSCAITQDRSVAGTTPSTIEFVNEGTATAIVNWLGFDGSRNVWFSLNPGRSVTQSTFIGHAWLVTDRNDTCIGFVVSDQPHKRYVVRPVATSTPPPAPPPRTNPPPVRRKTTRPQGRTINGTAAANVLKGTPYADKLYGRSGDDQLYGLAGADLLNGGPGADQLFCGAGRDIAIADRRDTVAADCEVVRGLPKVAPKPKPKPKPRARPKPKPKPAPSGAKTIRTSAGTLKIDAVQLTDRLPPGCIATSPICQVAEPGYRVLIVWLVRVGGGDPAAIAERLDAASRGSYVRASDGSRGEVAAGGLLAGSLFVAYTPRAGRSGFTLHWPGNRPIALGK